MRAVIVLLALVAAPICASVSQNRTGPTRPASSDRDALRNSNGRNGDWNDRDDGDQDDEDCVGNPPPPPPPTGAEIHGAVYNDANGDGLRDPTEVGLGTWFVMLAGSTVPPVQTDANGNYGFTG